MHTCNGVIFSVPTYDLTPSSLYTRFAQRFLAYELSFLLEIGVVKENPHTVAGLIAVGGSMHDWQTLALESLQATMFTMSLTVVDRFMSQRVGRPGNVLLHQEQLDRAHQMGENIVKAIQTPVEERTWLGDPNDGVCPVCHSSLVYPGDPHWDGIEFPYECAVCGCGGDLGTNPETGKPMLVIDPENGKIRDRNNDKARAEHLNEIIQTRIGFFQQMDEVKPLMAKYRDMKFPTFTIER
jgi:multimeric flavodoxin WrbA